MRNKLVGVSLLLGAGFILISTQVTISFKRGNHTGVKVVPIVYGMPNLQDSEAANRGEIALGGCIFNSFSPRWQVVVEL